ncbi:TetR/AcrR family transcriptional regulator [Streptomyces oceani]|uniref:TetR family transcriptional regulator n=1 Tax=Streptomyces oceani TaxID=1075402 RepID=A0A1E7JYV9_9ACTN|nr:TetR family transcriptional regulator [Streptomyces oceani]OEU96878.1 TetR family transcriptional regulator [Streptomyces oceani]
MGRRFDPERRQRLIDATLRVVGEHGVAGLSHRRVAAEADVPLGSTTYHFASRDDLLHAALGQAMRDWLAAMDRWERSVPREGSLTEEFTRFVVDSLTEGQERTRLEYELYLTALTHPSVRPLAAECLDGTAAVLRRRTPDDVTARALAALLDGLMLELLLTGRPVDPEEISARLAPLTDPR